MTDSTTQEFVPPPVDLMIDIETLDVLPTAQIVQIGLCEIPTNYRGRLDRKELQALRTLRVNVRPDSQSGDNGYTESGETINWWKADAARWKLLQKCESEGLSIVGALGVVQTFIAKLAPRHVWCNGASFDFAILRNACDIEGIDLPWKHWQERDLRTWKMLVQEDVYKARKELIVKAFGLQLHDALDDAILQAYQVADIYDELSFLLGAKEGEYDCE